MRVLMVMFDSLNRDMLEPYGGNLVKTPNFTRMAEHSVTFDNCYAGSLPCMPARRELHTGRYNFLHRSWGPLEPFDDSMPEILNRHHIHSHLVTDHYHYLCFLACCGDPGSHLHDYNQYSGSQDGSRVTDSADCDHRRCRSSSDRIFCGYR